MTQPKQQHTPETLAMEFALRAVEQRRTKRLGTTHYAYLSRKQSQWLADIIVGQVGNCRPLHLNFDLRNGIRLEGMNNYFRMAFQSATLFAAQDRAKAAASQPAPVAKQAATPAAAPVVAATAVAEEKLYLDRKLFCYVARVRADRFDFSKERKSFVEELSTLSGFNPDFGNLQTAKRITLVNPKTGGEMEFERTAPDVTPDNEIAGWNYQSTAGYRLLLIND